MIHQVITMLAKTIKRSEAERGSGNGYGNWNKDTQARSHVKITKLETR